MPGEGDTNSLGSVSQGGSNGMVDMSQSGEHNSGAEAASYAEKLHQLQREIDALQARAAAQPVVQVHMPSPTPKLGVFTGLKPKGGAEVDFGCWRRQVDQYLQETVEPTSADVLRCVRASLKGVAAEQ